MEQGETLLLDVSRLVWRAWEGRLPTGIDRTCLAYVARYRQRARAVVQRSGFTSVLSAAVSRQLFDYLLNQQVKSRSALTWLLSRGLLGGGRAAELGGLTYLNVGHTGLDKPGHAEWLRRAGVRPVYFVHDLIPLTHPEYCRREEPEKHRRRMTALLTHGTGVIGNSRETINELAVFSGLQRSLQMPPALVAPLGIGSDRPGISSASALRIPGRPYFVMLGTIEGRKNHLLILNVWAHMARRLGSACPQLVVIGQRGWECEQAVDMLERCEAIRGHVIELSRCDDDLLQAYMAGARALLFPSFVEGYGLPLVEALACGTPAIVSDLAVFRELAGAIPDYLSPLDGPGWMRAIADYARPESSARASQLGRMSGWTAPTWERHFTLVDRWLGQLSEQPPVTSNANG